MTELSGRWFGNSFGPGGPRGRTKPSMVALGGMLLIAAISAILDWPWWLQYALMVPTGAWLVVSARLVVYRQLKADMRPQDHRVPVVLVVPIMVIAVMQVPRFSGCLTALAFAVVYSFSKLGVSSEANDL